MIYRDFSMAFLIRGILKGEKTVMRIEHYRAGFVASCWSLSDEEGIRILHWGISGLLGHR